MNLADLKYVIDFYKDSKELPEWLLEQLLFAYNRVLDQAVETFDKDSSDKNFTRAELARFHVEIVEKQLENQKALSKAITKLTEQLDKEFRPGPESLVKKTLN